MPTERQQAALTLLSEQPERRHLYLSPQSGGYFVTYSAGAQYEPLNRADIDELLAGGWITECWRDFFKLAPTKAN